MPPKNEEDALVRAGPHPNTDHVRRKVLNVSVPEPVYWHIRQCANESRMSLKQFMAAFCQTAKPIVTAPATAEGPQ